MQFRCLLGLNFLKVQGFVAFMSWFYLLILLPSRIEIYKFKFSLPLCNVFSALQYKRNIKFLILLP